MTFRCEDLERALEGDDPSLLLAARAHARTCDACREELLRADELAAAARSLHREWKSDNLWPAIAARLEPRRSIGRAILSWPGLAAAAVILLAVAVSFVALGDRPVTNDRLLSDDALSEIERAEAQYVKAIEALAVKATANNDAQSPLLMNLRERLLVIDTAIANCRAEIDRNRFNTHLRRQLLSMYQEKRRTLEQILEQEKNAS
jgi:hypothetical protein